MSLWAWVSCHACKHNVNIRSHNIIATQPVDAAQAERSALHEQLDLGDAEAGDGDGSASAPADSAGGAEAASGKVAELRRQLGDAQQELQQLKAASVHIPATSALLPSLPSLSSRTSADASLRRDRGRVSWLSMCEREQ